MQYYSTKQFSELTGWCTRVLKKWRKNGKLVPDIIEPNGYCKYSHEQLVNNMKPVNGELVKIFKGVNVHHFKLVNDNLKGVNKGVNGTINW